MNRDELEKQELDLTKQIQDLDKQLNEYLSVQMNISDPEDFDTYVADLGHMIQNLTNIRKTVIAIKFYTDELGKIYKKLSPANNIENQNLVSKEEIIV